MQSRRAIFFISGLIIIYCANSLFAQNSGSSFLTITPSVRSYALGQSSVISATGADALGANPANMGFITNKFDVMTSYATVMDGDEFEHIAAVLAPEHLGFTDALGLSLTRLQISGLQGADASGNKTTNRFGANSTALTGAASIHFNKDLRLGVSAKAIRLSIDNYKSNIALATDLGMTYSISSLSKPMTVSASFNNLGMGTKFLNESDPLPTVLQIGAAWPINSVTTVAHLRRYIYDRQTDLGIGAEFLIRVVALRIGYITQGNPSNNGLKDQNISHRFMSGLTGGIGIQFGNAKLNYAISQQGVEYQTTHRISFSLQWGGPKPNLNSSSRQNPSAAFEPDIGSNWNLRSMGGY